MVQLRSGRNTNNNRGGGRGRRRGRGRGRGRGRRRGAPPSQQPQNVCPFSFFYLFLLSIRTFPHYIYFIKINSTYHYTDQLHSIYLLTFEFLSILFKNLFLESIFRVYFDK